MFHEYYGEVTREQLNAYRKYNISQTDHDTLVEHFGDNPKVIVRAIKDNVAQWGEFNFWTLLHG